MIIQDINCPSCKKSIETLHHIIYECQVATDIRRALRKSCSNTYWPAADHQLLNHWSLILNKNGPTDLWNDIIIAWTLWWNKNQKLFNKTALSERAKISQFYDNLSLINDRQVQCSTGGKKVCSHHNQEDSNTSIPHIFVDGAYKDRKGGSGWSANS